MHSVDEHVGQSTYGLIFRRSFFLLSGCLVFSHWVR